MPGERAARVIAGDTQTPFEFEVAEPGWTMFMISHFHYDLCGTWNTQGACTSVGPRTRLDAASRTTPSRSWPPSGDGAPRAGLQSSCWPKSTTSKPYFDAHPEDRDDLLRFIAEGRVEVMGGTYNEQHQPHRPGDGDPELRARHRFQRDISARIPRRPGSWTSSATTRSSRDGGGRRPDVQ